MASFGRSVQVLRAARRRTCSRGCRSTPGTSPPRSPRPPTLASSVTTAPSGANSCQIRSKNSSGWASSRYLFLRSTHVQLVHGPHGLDRSSRTSTRTPARARRRRRCAGTAPLIRRCSSSTARVQRGAVPGRLADDAQPRVGDARGSRRGSAACTAASPVSSAPRTAPSQVAGSGTSGSARSENGRLSSRAPRASSHGDPDEPADRAPVVVERDPGLRGEPVGAAHGARSTAAR